MLQPFCYSSNTNSTEGDSIGSRDEHLASIEIAVQSAILVMSLVGKDEVIYGDNILQIKFGIICYDMLYNVHRTK